MKGEEPDVNREDQTYINEFSKLYTKNKLKDKELKEIKEVLDSLEDAAGAIDEAFGHTLKLNIGETFLEVDEDQAKDYVDKMKKKYVKKQKDAQLIFDQTKKRLDELKVILYAKFGNRLRLDEE